MRENSHDQKNEENKARDIEALRARIAKAHAESFKPTKPTVWDGVRNSMMKMQKAGAGSLKLDDMKKAVAENMDTFKASLSNMKVAAKLDKVTSSLGLVPGLLDRLEQWKQSSSVLFTALVLVIFLLVGGAFMLSPRHIGVVALSANTSLADATPPLLAASTSMEESPNDVYSTEAPTVAAPDVVPSPLFHMPAISSVPTFDRFENKQPENKRPEMKKSEAKKSEAKKLEARNPEARKLRKDTREDDVTEVDVEEPRKKLSPKERRAQQREEALLLKVDQHVNEYKERLVQQLHGKKLRKNPDDLVKSGFGSPGLDDQSKSSKKRTIG